MGERDELSKLWPASAVVVRSKDLELRWIDDELLVHLAELAGRGIHDESVMPFNVPWSRGNPLEVARSVVTYQWNARSQIAPIGTLALELAVLVDGKPVGIQGASGVDWRVNANCRDRVMARSRVSGSRYRNKDARRICLGTVRRAGRGANHLGSVRRQPALCGGLPPSRL